MSLAEKLTSTPTADKTGNIVTFPTERVTGSGAMALSREYADLREWVEDLGADVVRGHHQALSLDWRERTAKRSQRGAAELLRELSEARGLSWTSIAKLLGLTVQTLRNWRRGEAVGPENRLKLAGLAAYLELLWSQSGIEDPAGWMEVPIVPGIPLTPVDAYARGLLPNLFEFSCNRVSAEALLNAIEPEWRKKYEQSNWEIFEAGDGHLSIRAKKESK